MSLQMYLGSITVFCVVLTVALIYWYKNDSSQMNKRD